MRSNAHRFVEAVGVAASGAVLAGATGSLIGLGVPCALVGAVNGALSGRRGIYNWRAPDGVLAFVLDSTWGLPMTAAGLVANTFGLVSTSSGYVAELSERNNRHVYRRGFMPRKGFAVTLGNVISGAADVERDRRARLITDHEDVHVWQARWFGPLYPVLYGGWMIAGGAAGSIMWVVARRRRSDGLFKTVESVAYFLNPFEWWAYSRDDYWPPNGKIVDFGWRRACCRPLTEVRPQRPSGLAQIRRR